MSEPLHIAMIHNRYQYVGGEDVSTDADVELLRAYGHQVSLIELHNDSIKTYSQLEKLRLFAETPWNQRIYGEIRSHLQTLQPDILHVQNFFPLFSPSVHGAAKSLNIPSIQHLHNFRLGCLNGYLFRNGKICQTCVGHNPWRGVPYRCYRDSAIASLAVWGMVTLNRWRRTWEQDVSGFITPSQFAANQLQQIGIPSDRLHVKPSVINPPIGKDLGSNTSNQPNFLFVGRLSPEKGVIILLQAWAALNQPDWQLTILGDGAERLKLERFVVDSGLKNVKFLGYLPAAQIMEVIQSATAIAVPSQWYETFGRVVIEAFACEKPVLASDLGALSELITPAHNGFLLPSDRPDSWTAQLYWCGKNPEVLKIMGANARQTYQANYTRLSIYNQLIKIYNSVLSPTPR
ncbi:MAG: glycosyltransferase family 4 protein [Pseudanabaenaceae cyanobacterium bins.68]|nr:glycosyltransferase family 4 protein [Pseudanabaenaceae cyanobacterium bins.68]